MKLQELTEKYENIWYHGSSKNFDKFDLEAVRANRGTNVAGIYLTKDEDLARDYASRSGGTGFVYEVQHEAHNPFVEGKNEFTDEMMNKYVELLVKHTNYNEKWARESLVPEAQKHNKLKADLDGDIKRQVYEAGGYDSYLFNDMGDRVLVVFDPNDITILNKFQPQQTVKDPEYDKHVAQKKEEPEKSSTSASDAFSDFENWLSGS